MASEQILLLHFFYFTTENSRNLYVSNAEVLVFVYYQIPGLTDWI